MFCCSANNQNDGNQNLSEFSLGNSHFSGYNEKTFKTDLPKGGKQQTPNQYTAVDLC
jgi:hypothetical protein